jgi:hypothetical protein
VETGGTLEIAGGVALNTRTLENGGTGLWTGTGNISLGSIITNRAGALFDAQNATTLSVNAVSARFDNAGTFRKSANAGTLTVANGSALGSNATAARQAASAGIRRLRQKELS